MTSRTNKNNTRPFGSVGEWMNGKCAPEIQRNFKFNHGAGPCKIIQNFYFMCFSLYAFCCVTQFPLILCQPYKTLICSKLLPTGNPHFKKITTKSTLLTLVVFLSTLIQKEQKGSKKRVQKVQKSWAHRTPASHMIFYGFAPTSFLSLVITIALKLALLT